MSGLTAEQRLRMEENRRKALERKAITEALKNNQNLNPASTKSNVVQQPISSSASNWSASRAQNFSSGSCKSKPVGITEVKPTSWKNPNLMRPQQLQSNSSNPVGQLPVMGKSLSGTCVLVSRDRFMVEIPYHAQLIAIFKSIEGSNYDAATRKWSFPVSQHGKLMTAVEPLKPVICLGGLPSNVLKICRTPPLPIDEENKERILNSIDPAMKDLMPFQEDGVVFGVNRNGRVLIADDMGLGKTIQALGIAHYYYKEWPLLIVAPSSVRYAWREAIWKWLPTVSPGSIFVVETCKDIIESAKVVIMSYELLQRKAEDVNAFKVVIMDESHNLKNKKTARARAAMPIIQRAKRAILLSGTPALSRPLELYSQISSVNHNLFPNINDFGIRYCDGKKNAWGWDFSGSSNMQELQIILEETIMIRRMKSDVLQQLPAKLRKLVILDPSLVKLSSTTLRATATAYHEGKQLKSLEKRGLLLEYYSETARAKLKAVGDYIKDMVEAKKKFICFAHHRYLLDGICEVLDSVKCKYIRIDGSTSAEDRQYSVGEFQSCCDILVAVLSITAANTGITLTAAGSVVFAELYWNPGVLTQAEDRAHRIGQQDSVSVEYLIAKGTSDDVMWPMVQGKLNVLNQAGLSKDNFYEAEMSSYAKQTDPSKSGIQAYFKPLSDSSAKDNHLSSINNESTNSAVAETVGSEDFMFEDDDSDMLLLQVDEQTF